MLHLLKAGGFEGAGVLNDRGDFCDSRTLG